MSQLYLGKLCYDLPDLKRSTYTLGCHILFNLTRKFLISNKVIYKLPINVVRSIIFIFMDSVPITILPN